MQSLTHGPERCLVHGERQKLIHGIQSKPAAGDQDGPVFPAEFLAQDLLDGMIGSGRIHLIPLQQQSGVLCLGQLPISGGDPDIVKQNVRHTELRFQFIKGSRNGSILRSVGCFGGYFDPLFPELRLILRQMLRVPGHQNDMEAVSSELFRHPVAAAIARA